MSSPHPKGAITTLEDLKDLIILGLSGEVWDIDMNTIRERVPTAVVDGTKGLIIHFKDGMGQYAKWYGIKDPSYNALEVLYGLPDSEMDKAEALTPSMYLFNTREEAVAAKAARDLERKKRYEAERAVLRRGGKP